MSTMSSIAATMAAAVILSVPSGRVAALLDLPRPHQKPLTRTVPVSLEQATPLRGYTIPLVDLSTETALQVIVDREAGQYLGHPSTVLLEDGRTVIVVYPKGHGQGGIVLKRSVDGGRTWSARQPTPPSWATSKETPTIHRVVDASGRRRLVVFSGLYPIRLSVSEDDGLSWSELKPIGAFGGIVAMSAVTAIETGSGHYMAFFHDDGRFFRADGRSASPVAFTVYKTLSTDGGLTWSAPEAVFASSDVHLCEPGVIRSPDGRRLAMLLRENARRKNSHIMFSDDEGRTWSAPKELPGALTGDRHVGVRVPDGRLFITFRDTTLESSTKGDWVAWVGTWDDLAQGREGQYRVRLMDNADAWDCCYPGLEVLPDGTLLTTTYGHWASGEPPFIVSVRLTMAAIDAAADEAGFGRRREPRVMGPPGPLGAASWDEVQQEASLVKVAADGSPRVVGRPLRRFRPAEVGRSGRRYCR